ncbi:N-acetylmuramoyl-L-alanine amidase family protein [Psychroserpens algicola]|uniref:N-acetylmuramoyl-L-alanine amidase n=1 Tax=Psychroserpens algicola TaxID=1719034 RepID=A0ABT0HAL9_9FLAO|nr:N-acetylmuramoyl-L-alanine amidase [Psychroserpens algicola]MCK8481418.1 N-acetylmuramoyl-L-alanine amidase [Psychroserpens algicola]
MRTTLHYIFVLTVLLITSFLTSAHAFQKNSDKFVVVLDAGHGGHDSGNVGNGYRESNIALNIVLQVGKELEKNKDIKVIYTRTKDVFVTLRGRAKIANDADADLFVSVHCNAHNSSANGTETFVLGLHANQRNFEIAKKENEVIFLESDYEKHYEGFDPNSPESFITLSLIQEDYLDQSIRLARYIEDNFKSQQKRKSRGVKQAGFWVLHNTYMPSVLVETGFLTYKKEGSYLNSKTGQSKMSKSITDAILDYKKQLDLNVGENIYNDSNTVPTEVEEPQIIDNVVFKVQIAASSKKLEPKSYNFKGLDDISREKVGNFYKYFYGYTSDYSQIKQLQIQAKSKGYKDCFVVAYRDGKKIDVSEALKSASN